MDVEGLFCHHLESSALNRTKYSQIRKSFRCNRTITLLSTKYVIQRFEHRYAQKYIWFCTFFFVCAFRLNVNLLHYVF